MGARIEQDDRGIWVLRIAGALRKEELDDAQASCVEILDTQENARVLVIVEKDFRGWVGSEVWNDMTFYVKHGGHVAKIAIVGAPKWKDRMLMFTGAGFRHAQVKYFVENQLTEAYTWLG